MKARRFARLDVCAAAVCCTCFSAQRSVLRVVCSGLHACCIP
jgi:hypothetical protein